MSPTARIATAELPDDVQAWVEEHADRLLREPTVAETYGDDDPDTYRILDVNRLTIATAMVDRGRRTLTIETNHATGADNDE